MINKSLSEKIWLTTNEAASYLGKSRNALWLLVSRGFLRKRKWQGDFILSAPRLIDFLKQL